MPPKSNNQKRTRRTKKASDSDESYHSDGFTRARPSKKPATTRHQLDSEQETIVDTVSLGPDGEKVQELQDEVNKLEKERSDSDKYCKMCDDGGDLIECNRCGFFYCYDEQPRVLDDDENATIHRGCVTLSPGYVEDPWKQFHCPDCLSEHPSLSLDYYINRGFSTSQRRAVVFQVVILVSYLPGFKERAEILAYAITSLLGAFEVVAVALFLTTTTLLSTGDYKWIYEKHPFHFVFLFITESSPGGGWCTEEFAQSDVATWLQKIVCHYNTIAAKAVTARVFGLCCGLNLTEDGTIPAILQSLIGSGWDSIVLPTASSVLPEEIGTIFPELFAQIYYNSIPLESAIVRVWAASKRARVHTDILMMNNLRTQPIVRKYRYGSLSSRPYGIDLPAPWSFCICARANTAVSWELRHHYPVRHGEHLMRYRTSCKHVRLDVAIFLGEAMIRSSVGVQVIAEEFDSLQRMFPLDSPESVTMRPRLALSGEAPRGEEHTSAWTAFGQRHASLRVDK